MILRLSQKLNTKIKAGALKARQLNENPYADWSCHLFTADRTQYVLITNTPSFYLSVMFGRGITDDSHFIERALSSIREFMDDDGQSFVDQKFVAIVSDTVGAGKSNNVMMSGLVKFFVSDELGMSIAV